jgi:hypothetical protein
MDTRSSPAGANRIAALYWDNVEMRVVAAQRRVLAHLGFTIDQCERTKLDHGVFLDSYMAGLGEDDVALFLDIDCFPMNREIVDAAFAAARAGRIYGCAQSANHIDPDAVYAAPMFLAISKATWEALGRPSFRSDAENDIAQRLNKIAASRGVAVDLLYPWASIVPKWRLGEVALYGIGTFYRGGVFHLFEGRSTPYAYILFDVADAVCSNRPVDYRDLMQRALRLRGDERWSRRLTRWRKMIWWRRLRRALGVPV